MGGWKNRALLERQHCLIPLQGFKGALYVCAANGIFNNPWERRHTHRKNTLMRVHWGWHFLSAPLFPPPGSPWHQRQQDSLPAGRNEKSSWRKEEQGSEEERGDQEEKGRRLMLRRAPWHNSPLAHPTLPLCVDRIWNYSAWLHWYRLELGMVKNLIYLFSLKDQIKIFLGTGQNNSTRIVILL